MSVNKYDKTTGQLIPISGNDVSKPAYFDTKAEAEQALSSISEGSLICTGDEWDTTTYDELPTQGSENIVKSGGVWNSINLINSNFGTVELTSTAAYPHAVGEYFINAAGQMVKCTAAIAVGDTITIGTNVTRSSVSQAASELNSNLNCYIMSHFTYYQFQEISDPSIHIISTAWGEPWLKIKTKCIVGVTTDGFNIVVKKYGIYTNSCEIILGFNVNTLYSKIGHLTFPTGQDANSIIKVYVINGYFEIYIQAEYAMLDIDFTKYGPLGSYISANDYVSDMTVEFADDLPSETAQTITWN